MYVRENRPSPSTTRRHIGSSNPPGQPQACFTAEWESIRLTIAGAVRRLIDGYESNKADSLAFTAPVGVIRTVMTALEMVETDPDLIWTPLQFLTRAGTVLGFFFDCSPSFQARQQRSQRLFATRSIVFPADPALR